MAPLRGRRRLSQFDFLPPRFEDPEEFAIFNHPFDLVEGEVPLCEEDESGSRPSCAAIADPAER